MDQRHKIKRQQAVQEVLTVYDNDTELDDQLARMVECPSPTCAHAPGGLEQRVTEPLVSPPADSSSEEVAKPSRTKSHPRQPGGLRRLRGRWVLPSAWRTQSPRSSKK